MVSLWDEWSQAGPAVLLESGGESLEGTRWSILAGFPVAEVREIHEGFQQGLGGEWKVCAEPFEVWMDSQTPSMNRFQPFPWCLADAWFGALSYEWGRSGRFLPKTPLLHFFKPGRVLALDRSTREFFLMGQEPFELPVEDRAPEGFKAWDLRAGLTQHGYEEKVRSAQDYIAQGDIYQANIAQPFEARWEGGPSGLYRLIRELNPGPFMGAFRGDGFTLVSSSPERLVLGRGDRLETKPIAGTRPRGNTETQDLQLREELRINPKEKAEHLMLVDLARNDLGRVSCYGTVEVTRFAEVERYAKVQHLVSTVISKRAEDATFSKILRSLFPGGTITGCPKVRCMEIIEELEERPRGFYTGSLGYFAPGPVFDMNILIRTFTLFPDGRLEFLAGAGIVADSHPAREYQETLYKVQALAQALGVTWEVAP
jgi:anthranilate/para-aminobenzoate synthase component I